MAAAAKWVDDNAGQHERFFLFVTSSTRTSPSILRIRNARMYDDTWEGPHLIWPPYHAAAQRKRVLTERQAYQVRSQYGAKLTMIDHWFGKVIAGVGTERVMDDTAVILLHGPWALPRRAGHLGKPAVPVYEPLGHIPLMSAGRESTRGTNNALTTSVDIFATLCDLFRCDARARTHGKSLIPLLTGEATAVRDWALLGVWGREVHLVDDESKVRPRARERQLPDLDVEHRWSTMAAARPNPPPNLPKPDERAFLGPHAGTKVR
jgi:arylsulfatase A-like enzyme